MQATLFSISLVFLHVFGKQMPEDMPYSLAGEQIVEKRDDWRFLITKAMEIQTAQPGISVFEAETLLALEVGAVS